MTIWNQRDQLSRTTLNPQFDISNESVTEQFPYASSTEIPEGYGVIRNTTTGMAEKATSSSTIVYLTKVSSNSTTVQDIQESGPDVDSVLTTTPSAGGLPVWATRGHKFDMPTSNFDTGDESPAAGGYVCISDGTDGKLEPMAAPAGGRISFGRIEKVSGGRVYFTWNIHGTTHA